MTGDNAEQQDFWTDEAGPIWVAQMDAMDAQLGPVLDGVLARAKLQTGERVLDIGCGAGTSTIEAACLVGTAGHALGVDISKTLLGVANARATEVPQVGFALGDAQSYAFEQQGFDCLISRFGVMFFEDPVAAFANMAQALRPAGRMVFAAWGAIPDNPFFTLPAMVSKAVLGAVPKVDPDAPGPFAFREAARVVSILQAAGLQDILVEETMLDLVPEGDPVTVAKLMCEIGPAHRALAYFDANTAQRNRLIEALADAVKVFDTPEGIRIPAAINFVTAIKPA